MTITCQLNVSKCEHVLRDSCQLVWFAFCDSFHYIGHGGLVGSFYLWVGPNWECTILHWGKIIKLACDSWRFEKVVIGLWISWQFTSMMIHAVLLGLSYWLNKITCICVKNYVNVCIYGSIHKGLSMRIISIMSTLFITKNYQNNTLINKYVGEIH